jgi:SAM-dependent methyltransferase
VHENRARAESFGAVAEQYDRFRPSYPDDLITYLIELEPEWTLDVACGTGKVAVPLLASGLAVLGVEQSEHMAEIARRHGIIVEVAKFETWDAHGRTFDLVTCGQGWHWIDPVEGPKQVASVMNSGATLALFWNFAEIAAGKLRDALEEVYAEHAPELIKDESKQGHEDDETKQALETSGLFASVRSETFPWSTMLTTDEWLGRVGTHSDHLTLPDRKRARLLDAVRSVIDDHDGIVELRGGTYAIFARTPES